MRNSARDEPNAAAHSLCMSKKAGLQDEHGKVLKDKVKQELSRFIKDETKLEEAVRDCAVDKDTPEGTARHLFDSMRKYGPQRPSLGHTYIITYLNQEINLISI